MFGFPSKPKAETVEEVTKQRKKVLSEYFNGEIGKGVFKAAVETAEKADKEACLLRGICSHWFAKGHDKDFPNFFVNPCWEMSDGCLCPLRQEGCDNCQRKIGNNPLC